MFYATSVFEHLKSIGVIALIQDQVENAKTKPGSGFRAVGYDLLTFQGQRASIALSSYWKHESGDMMADPDIQITVDLKTEKAVATAFQQDGVPGIGAIYIDIYPTDEPKNAKAEIQVNHFLCDWLQRMVDTKQLFV